MSKIHKSPPQKFNCTLLSLVVIDDEWLGHNYVYAQAVGRSASMLGWNHLAAISKSNKYSDMVIPDNWTCCLDCRNVFTAFLPRKTFFSRIIELFFDNPVASYRLGKSIATYLDEIIQSYPTDKIVLLVDSFHVPELLAIILSLLRISEKNRVCVWFVYRYEISKKRIHIYRFLNQILEQVIPVDQIKLLTDSKTLAEYLSGYFKRHFSVLPIPHTSETITITDGNQRFSETIRQNKSEILAWWPGRPRANKGLVILQKIASIAYDISPNVCIVAGQGSSLQQVTGGVRIELVNDVLAREEYVELLHTVDVILLPYDPKNYRLQTSGIFTESVCAGKVPFVTEGTWMSSELREYELERLILDWETPNLFSLVREIANNSVILDKLGKLRRHYMNYHSEYGYGQAMFSLYEESIASAERVNDYYS
jgi:hypothetical protein